MGHTVQPQPREERRDTNRALRVLVADDDADTVQTLTALLELEGHVVRAVFSGAEVLPAVPSFRPDAIILDISIPGLSGYAVAQAVRHSFTDMRRPLMIAISGMWKQAGDRLVAQNVGFDHYLVKPCDPREVVQLLNKLGNRGMKAPEH
jgi:DNA-binding response OmpR family regulator